MLEKGRLAGVILDGLRVRLLCFFPLAGRFMTKSFPERLLSRRIGGKRRPGQREGEQQRTTAPHRKALEISR
jgi:hypothetical protein